MKTICHRLGLCCCLWLLVVTAGCGQAPAPQLPAGIWLSGRADASRQWLERLEILEQTRAAAMAKQLVSRLAGCDVFTASSPDGDIEALVASATCAQEPERITELRGTADLIFGASALGLIATAQVEPAGGGTIEIVIDGRRIEGAARMLLPAASGRSVSMLSTEDALLSIDMTTDEGLDLGAWVAQDQPAAQMFGLRSRLFSKAVLDGSWQLAVLPPAPGEAAVPLAAALGLRSRSAAQAAFDVFAEQLHETWDLTPSELSIAGSEGGCFDELRVLPGLKPCWLWHQDALLVGWNPQTLERVASSARHRQSDLPGARLEVDFSRISNADRHLADAHGGEVVIPVGYPWSRVTASGWKGVQRYQLRVELEP